MKYLQGQYNIVFNTMSSGVVRIFSLFKKKTQKKYVKCLVYIFVFRYSNGIKDLRFHVGRKYVGTHFYIDVLLKEIRWFFRACCLFSALCRCFF